LPAVLSPDATATKLFEDKTSNKIILEGILLPWTRSGGVQIS
jgi:hypothetical protein